MAFDVSTRNNVNPLKHELAGLDLRNEGHSYYISYPLLHFEIIL